MAQALFSSAPASSLGLLAVPSSLQVLLLVSGMALLFFGRRLFAPLVGLVLAVAGYFTGAEILRLPAEALSLALGGMLGALGAITAIRWPAIPLAAGGLIVGGYSMIALLENLNAPLRPWAVALVLLGAAVGSVLTGRFHRPALVLFTSLAGAFLMVETLALNSGPKIASLFLLAAAGLGIQTGWWSRWRSTGAPGKGAPPSGKEAR